MRKLNTLVLAALLLLVAMTSGSSLAQEPSVFDATRSPRDNLKQIQASGKSAELVLKNGKSYSGKLAAVGDNVVIVTQITGREFFDALILLDEIAAVEVRVR